MSAVTTLKAALVATVFAASAVAGPPAWADHGHVGHGNYRHYGHASWGWGLGLLAGTAIVLAATEARPAYYPPVYAPPPVVVAPRVVAPPAYVEQTWWYYCNRPAGYYPYVSACPSGWTRVAPTPPG